VAFFVMLYRIMSIRPENGPGKVLNASSIKKKYLYILIINVKQYWLSNVDGVHLVNVSCMASYSQQCLGYFFGHMGLLLSIGICLLPTK
jgi:hypothetical protein